MKRFVILTTLGTFKLTPRKILIVSQWTACLTLVSNYLTENCIPHVKYADFRCLYKQSLISENIDTKGT